MHSRVAFMERLIAVTGAGKINLIFTTSQEYYFAYHQ